MRAGREPSLLLHLDPLSAIADLTKNWFSKLPSPMTPESHYKAKFQNIEGNVWLGD